MSLQQIETLGHALKIKKSFGLSRAAVYLRNQGVPVEVAARLLAARS